MALRLDAAQVLCTRFGDALNDGLRDFFCRWHSGARVDSFRRFLSLLGLLAGLLHGQTATAQALPNSWPVPAGTSIPGGLVDGRTVQVTSPGRVAVNDPIKVPVGVSAVANVTRSRPVTAAAAAAAIGSAAARMIPWVTAAALATAAVCDLGASGWVCDQLQPKVPVESYCQTFGYVSGYGGKAGGQPGKLCGPTPTLVSQQLAEKYVSYGWQVRYVGPQGFEAYAGFWMGIVVAPTLAITQQCPELSPGIPPPPGWGDKCATGVMSPATPEQVQERIEPAVSNKLDQAVQEALKQGVDIATDPAQQSLTGPARVSDPATTSTRTAPDGTPQTKTEQKHYDISYSPTNVTWNVTTVTNNYDGTTETKEEAPEKPEKSECELHPDTLGCAQWGEAEGPEIDAVDLPVTWAPDGGWGSGGSCPAVSTISTSWGVIPMDNTLLCRWLDWMRPVVLAMAALTGAFIFLSGLKS